MGSGAYKILLKIRIYQTNGKNWEFFVLETEYDIIKHFSALWQQSKFLPIEGEKHANWLARPHAIYGIIDCSALQPTLTKLAKIVCPRKKRTATENAGADEK